MSATAGMVTTVCDTCREPITVPIRPYRAKRLCEGCAAFDRLRGIEQAAQRLWWIHDNFVGLAPHERRQLEPAWLDLRDALAVPEPKGDH